LFCNLIYYYSICSNVKQFVEIGNIITPDSTGSGIYVQAMIREASAYGYDNYLVAGIRSDCFVDTDCIEQDNNTFVNFHNADLYYHIPAMSDVDQELLLIGSGD